MIRPRKASLAVLAGILILSLAFAGSALAADGGERDTLWNRILTVVEQLTGSEAPPPDDDSEAGSDMDPNGLQTAEEQDH